MSLKHVLTEKITLLKSNGTRLDDIPASVQEECIFVGDVSVPIESGDTIKRQVPSGIEESFTVVHPGYQAGLGPIQPHYQVKYNRAGNERKSKPNLGITYNVSGVNPRVNVNSVDQSLNIDVSDQAPVFTQLREIIQNEIHDESERLCLLKRLDELTRTCGTGEFSDAYKEFMATAANHVVVLAPVLPALSALLP